MILALVILLVAVFWLLPTPPPARPTASSRGERIRIPGPVIAALSQGLLLDGLTIIPLCVSASILSPLTC